MYNKECWKGKQLLPIIVFLCVCACVCVCFCVCVYLCVCVFVYLSVCLFVLNILDTSVIPRQPECLVFSWAQAVVITCLNCTVIISEENLLIAVSTNDNRPIDGIIATIESLTTLRFVLSYNQFWICKFLINNECITYSLLPIRVWHL